MSRDGSRLEKIAAPFLLSLLSSSLFVNPSFITEGILEINL